MCLKFLSILLGTSAVLIGSIQPVKPQIASLPPLTDPIAKLDAKLKSGELKLDYEPGRGYLKAVLKELNIDPASQVLVFSKTSIHNDFITRKTPRAMYHNDRVYVGWVLGGPFLEIMSVDPKRGSRFYTLENDKPGVTGFDTPKKDCNRCHGSVDREMGAQLFMNSSYVAESGYNKLGAPIFRVSPATKLENRWGGWYVTGTHGKIRHLGNEAATGTDDSYFLDKERGANHKNLKPYLDTNQYLAPGSDIVSLLEMEQQLDIQNTLNAAHVYMREAKSAAEVSEAVEPVVQALIGSDEIELTDAIAGSSEFSAKFEASAPTDRHGRSLSQLDLKTRILKYGISPMIYAESFESLPKPARLAIYRRLITILKNGATDGALAQLSPAMRAITNQILTETKLEYKAILP